MDDPNQWEHEDELRGCNDTMYSPGDDFKFEETNQDE